MASQHFMAFSDTVVGLGHLQAAPYGCSKQLASEADHTICTTAPKALSVDKMINYTLQSYKEGKIE